MKQTRPNRKKKILPLEDAAISETAAVALEAVIPQAGERRIPAVALFAFTLFVSASLMFSLQPMFGKVLLPLLGGAPAVWNTCMVFYQSVLFLGYLYAHGLSTRFAAQRQIMIHGAVVLISLIALPIALPASAAPPAAVNPIPWLLWMLTVSIGLPFFAVSTSAPLLQKWFSGIGHADSHDPYFLYAASNAGSLIALLSYPLLIEPHIGLTQQKLFWSMGYGLLAGLIGLCAYTLWRTHRLADLPAQTIPSSEERLSLGTKLHWLALAFVPSSLLLGVTSFISTDVASVPLLWVIPLALYLLTFIIAFSRRGAKIHPAMVALQPAVLLPFLAFSFLNPAAIPYWTNLALHLLAFFFAAMVCHGELAKSRPPTQHLTAFYLILAFGGMLGGMFNTFLAPFLFDAVAEYPLMIVAALLLRPILRQREAPYWRQIALDLAFPLTMLGVGLYCYFALAQLGQYLDLIGTFLILLTGLTYALRHRPLQLGASTGVLLLFTIGLHGLVSNVILQERTFFGVLSIRESFFPSMTKPDQPDRYYELWHGTTKHGAQKVKAGMNPEPLTYYSRKAPMGQLFALYSEQNASWRVGVVGLGAGALACYAKPTQHWDFFEIDPAVVALANNPDYFTYLKDCAPQARMITGDARLSLAKAPAGHYDVLVLDAFSSDAVPTHLLTQEALALYLSKLKENGLIAFHITNRHLALKKVLSTLVQEMNLAALIQEYQPKTDEPYLIPADWAVITRHEKALDPLRQSRLGRWNLLPLYFGMRPWTDDFTNIISVWK